MKTLQAMKCCGMMGSHCVLGISFLAGIFQGVRFAQSQGRCLWDLETRWITRCKISTNLFITSELRCRRPIEKTSGSEQRCILGPKIRQCACRSMRKTCWLVRRCFCRNCFFSKHIAKDPFHFHPHSPSPQQRLQPGRPSCWLPKTAFILDLFCQSGQPAVGKSSVGWKK